MPVLARAAAVLTFVGGASGARADTGVYFAESIGVGLSHDELAPMLGQPLHVRVGVGVRLGDVAIEPWVLSDLQTERDGAFHGIIGGDPAMGSADLEHYGIDVKYIVLVHNRLSAYVRGGPSHIAANGVLDGYAGYGFGVGGGMQITGKVRALGFLWSPLFFLDRGPKITGSLFLDQGYDFMWLRKRDEPTIGARVGHVSVGFAFGSAF